MNGRGYRKELRERPGALQSLHEMSRVQTVTLVYGARDEEHNTAPVLNRIIESKR
ncbi:MAG: DUF488 family protein [Thermoguttaceae bacterium]|nr:DUF488 family protein [Thermoguttaceae bacterium]